MLPQLLHDTNSIFCHQVLLFFLPPEVSDNKPEVNGGEGVP